MSLDWPPESESNGEHIREVYVRSMLLRDIDRVMKIEQRSFPTPWSESVFCTELRENSNADYVVACRGDSLVGYAGMWLLPGTAHITNIAVDPDQRGRKVGTRLLLSMMQRALFRGINRMTLEVRQSNDIAQRFYRRYGFRVQGIRANYYTDTHEDAVVMKCEDIGDVLTDADQ